MPGPGLCINLAFFLGWNTWFCIDLAIFLPRFLAFLCPFPSSVSSFRFILIFILFDFGGGHNFI